MELKNSITGNFPVHQMELAIAHEYLSDRFRQVVADVPAVLIQRCHLQSIPVF
jgi:hypothetical protein